MKNISNIAQLEVSPKFILEIASGIRDPVDIAEDEGFSSDAWEALKVYPPFVAQVEAKKAELKASGYSFKMKSAFIAEDLLAGLYEKATEQGASFHTTLELAKFTARAAGLDSPNDEGKSTGSSFNISINLGGGNVVQIGGKMPTNSPKVQEIDLSDIESPEYTEIEDELSYDSTHYFTEFLPHPLPE